MNGILPPTIGAGLTFSTLATLTAYPASDWVLSVSLRGPSAIDLTATADGIQHRLEASATATAEYLPGLYAYSARVTDGSAVVEVERGTITVLPDLAQSTGGDMRSHARIVLDNIRAVIEKRATQDQQRYTINNRELWRTPISDLLKLETLYASRVRAEETAARGNKNFGTQVLMRLP
ncbi:hypothetical protein [Aquabacterium sp.]|uniref:hypothetical protein n=1 Tax=Aquabacterium sp. TaxID=1872578 RepID=UPI0025C0717D|nr:hypothetical protein [Aquabacterium sp.]